MLREALLNMGVDTILIDTWYKKDSNAVPFVYILQPISSILVNFNNKVVVVVVVLGDVVVRVLMVVVGCEGCIMVVIKVIYGGFTNADWLMLWL